VTELPRKYINSERRQQITKLEKERRVSLCLCKLQLHTWSKHIFRRIYCTCHDKTCTSASCAQFTQLHETTGLWECRVHSTHRLELAVQTHFRAALNIASDQSDRTIHTQYIRCLISCKLQRGLLLLSMRLLLILRKLQQSHRSAECRIKEILRK
jgi:hypothetical protein